MSLAYHEHMASSRSLARGPYTMRAVHKSPIRPHAITHSLHKLRRSPHSMALACRRAHQPACTLPLSAQQHTHTHSAASLPSHDRTPLPDEHRAAPQVVDGAHLHRDADGLKSCCQR